MSNRRRRRGTTALLVMLAAELGALIGATVGVVAGWALGAAAGLPRYRLGDDPDGIDDLDTALIGLAVCWVLGAWAGAHIATRRHRKPTRLTQVAAVAGLAALALGATAVGSATADWYYPVVFFLAPPVIMAVVFPPGMGPTPPAEHSSALTVRDGTESLDADRGSQGAGSDLRKRAAVIIRPERPEDVSAIAAIVEAAFGSAVERDLVEAIRGDRCYRPELALVAEDGGEIVGHVMVNHCELHDGDTVHRIGMLSPLAVTPSRQRDGIGSALVHEVLSRAAAAGDPLVILEGSPTYYSRFGFVDARTLGITIHLPDWAPPEAGQALTLSSYEPWVRGVAVYPPPFAGLG